MYTTWSDRITYKDFIASSKAGMEKGAFIMHRCHGTASNITADSLRAITKMKATITPRFTIKECGVDVEADCRFCFFFKKINRR